MLYTNLLFANFDHTATGKVVLTFKMSFMVYTKLLINICETHLKVETTFPVAVCFKLANKCFTYTSASKCKNAKKCKKIDSTKLAKLPRKSYSQVLPIFMI